jgi:hypothetical protein
MAFVKAKPSGPRASGMPTIGSHRIIPPPPPPPVFHSASAKGGGGKGNGDILRALASLSADIDRLIYELDNYSALCTDYFLEVLGLHVDNVARERRGEAMHPVRAGAPAVRNINDWADAVKRKSKAAQAAFEKQRAQEYQFYYREFAGLWGGAVSSEAVLARIAVVSAQLPKTFWKLAGTRYRQLNLVLQGVNEVV